MEVIVKRVLQRFLRDVQALLGDGFQGLLVVPHLEVLDFEGVEHVVELLLHDGLPATKRARCELVLRLDWWSYST